MSPMRVGQWLAAPLVCLAVYWRSFEAWFRGDDFAWLALARQVHGIRDLGFALFHPFAQGTVRPWSERAFFLAGYAMFGLDPLPFHIAVFATQILNLVLVTALGARLSGSRAAGICAASLWALHSAALEPLGWISCYNQVLCASFLLAAFYFLLRWIETGGRSYQIGMWAAFLLGFGANELNLVFPLLAAAYTFWCARPYLKRILPMAGVSAAYIAAHLLAAPVPESGDYAMHFSGAMLRTLARYWTWSAGPSQLWTPWNVPHWMLMAGIALVSLGLAVFVVSERRGAAFFCAAWYLITIAPVLPLRDHRMQYYVFVPLIGVCWLGGWALVDAWNGRLLTRLAAVALAGLYLAMVVPRSLASVEWQHRLTMRTRDLVLGVAAAHRLHPNQSILLFGVDEEQFRTAVLEHPFRLLDIDQVYLAPGSERRIPWAPDGDPAEFVLPAAAADRALAAGTLAVYDVTGPQLRNITTAYAAMPRESGLPSRLNLADPHSAEYLGPEWYEPDGNHRWMSRSASFRLAGPARTGDRLFLRGIAADNMNLTVAVDDVSLGAAAPLAEGPFEIALPLPGSAIGKPRIQVRLSVDHTVQALPDPRALGLAFGLMEIR